VKGYTSRRSPVSRWSGCARPTVLNGRMLRPRTGGPKETIGFTVAPVFPEQTLEFERFLQYPDETKGSPGSITVPSAILRNT